MYHKNLHNKLRQKTAIRQQHFETEKVKDGTITEKRDSKHRTQKYVAVRYCLRNKGLVKSGHEMLSAFDFGNYVADLEGRSKLQAHELHH